MRIRSRRILLPVFVPTFVALLSLACGGGGASGGDTGPGPLDAAADVSPDTSLPDAGDAGRDAATDAGRVVTGTMDAAGPSAVKASSASRSASSAAR